MQQQLVALEREAKLRHQWVLAQCCETLLGQVRDMGGGLHDRMRGDSVRILDGSGRRIGRGHDRVRGPALLAMTPRHYHQDGHHTRAECHLGPSAPCDVQLVDGPSHDDG